MSVYISLEAAIAAAMRADDNGVSLEDAKKMSRAVVAELESIPAADVRPVVRGHWKLRDGGVGVCSNCKSVLKDVWDYDSSDPFCSECGADMREVSTSEEPLNSEGTTRNGGEPAHGTK